MDFIYDALRWGQIYYELDIIIVKNLLLYIAIIIFAV